jgi:hypothetical protein
MAFIKFKEVVEHISSRQQLKVLLEDGTPTNIARASHITMINEARVNPFNIVGGLNDRHWRVKVIAFHRIATPRADLIDGIMGMSYD